ncbi:WD40 repeat domain-containing protein [Emticicia sp. BO119]|uniref:WD40 repeat domain-containing protein n=1 Tax=Emticicia sp. BO119 TaxID=2757768 RepID=UPI0015F0A9DC|nr:PD40 domain-containing protein [Emticicia sp. BO119]MBA4852391.1 PD40 domain-containing protein [Emticicia sp. BO119]
MKELEKNGYIITSQQYINALNLISYLKKKPENYTEKDIQQLLCPIFANSKEKQKQFYKIYELIKNSEVKCKRRIDPEPLKTYKVKGSYQLLLGLILLTIVILTIVIQTNNRLNYDNALIIANSIDKEHWNMQEFFLDSSTRAKPSINIKWLFGNEDITIIKKKDNISIDSNLINDDYKFLNDKNTSFTSHDTLICSYPLIDSSYIVKAVINDDTIIRNINIINPNIKKSSSETFKPQPISLKLLRPNSISTYHIEYWKLCILFFIKIILLTTILFFIAQVWVILLKRFKRRNKHFFNLVPPYSLKFYPQESGIVASESLELWAEQLNQLDGGYKQELNIKKSIVSTIKTGGFSTLIFKDVDIKQKYLILIDNSSIYDQQILLYAYMVQILEERGVEMEILFFHADPRFCWSEKHGSGIQIEKIQRVYNSYNLVLITDGTQLIDYKKGEVKKWFKHFFLEWENRCILTPKDVDDWNKVERILSTLFIILPATPKGQLLLRDYLLKNLEEPISFDLQKKEFLKVLSKKHRLSNKKSDELTIEEIENYLKESLTGKDISSVEKEALIQWACAIILYPEPHWALTLDIGKTIERYYRIKYLVTSNNLVKISSLPWTKEQKISDELIKRLHDRLDKNLESEIRISILELIKNAIPKDENGKVIENSYAYIEARIQQGLQWLQLHPKNESFQLERQNVFKDLKNYFYNNFLTNKELLKEFNNKNNFPNIGLIKSYVFSALLLFFSSTSYWNEKKNFAPDLFSKPLHTELQSQDSLAIYNNLAVQTWQHSRYGSHGTYDSCLFYLTKSLEIKTTKEAIYNLHALQYNYALFSANNIFLPPSNRIQTILDSSKKRFETIMMPFFITNKKWIPNSVVISDYLSKLRHPLVTIDSIKKNILKEYSNISKKIISENNSLIDSSINKARSKYDSLLSKYKNNISILQLPPSELEAFYSSLDSIEAQKILLYFGGTQYYSSTDSLNLNIRTLPTHNSNVSASLNQKIITLFGRAYNVSSLAFSPNGKYIASAGQNRLIEIWDWKNERITNKISMSFADTKSILIKFSHDSRYLLVVSGNRIEIFNSIYGDLVFEKEELYSINSSDFSYDDQYIAYVGKNGSVVIWDWQRNEAFEELKGEEFNIIKFSPDGKYIIGANNYNVFIWDWKKKVLVSNLKGNINKNISFTNDGKYIAIFDGVNINLWDLQTGRRLSYFPLDIKNSTIVIFSLDGNFIAIKSINKIDIWDWKYGKLLTSINNTYEYNNEIVFSPDGRYIAIGSKEGIIYIHAWQTY